MVAWHHVNGDPGLLRPYNEDHGPVFHSGAVFASRFFTAGTYVDDDFTDDESNVFPGIWSSTDGRTWELADIADLRTVSDLVAGPGGLLAVGDPTDENTPLWLTTNGVDWERISDTDFEGQRISKVGATDGYWLNEPLPKEIFVAAGSDLWYSTDGSDWHAYIAIGIDLPEIIPTELVRRGERFFTLIGGAASGGPLELWTSSDLIEWYEEGVELPHSTGARNVVLAEGPLGFVAAAHDDEEPGQTFMWFSADGFSWTEVSSAVGPVSDVFVDGTGFIAVGFKNTGTGCALWEGDIQGFTWTSVDGLNWATMPLDGFVGARVDQLFRNGRTLFGVGALYDEEVSQYASGSVWTARLPQVQPAGPAPAAAPTPTPEPGGCGPD